MAPERGRPLAFSSSDQLFVTYGTDRTMLPGSVRGNWRDLLLMARAPLAGTPTDDAAATGDRAADRYTASPLSTLPRPSPLYQGPLFGGIGR